MFTLSVLYAHSTFLIPLPRQKGYGFDPKDSCQGASGTNYKPVVTTKRGGIVATQWERNNHKGGFMRYSIVPMKDSATQGIFDKKENIFHYECAEKKCTAPKKGEMEDPDKNPSSCTGSIVIPDWVQDGIYTIQTSWYGTGNSYEGQYGQHAFQHCFDVDVQGGTTGQAPACPATFVGGDDTGPTDCKYFIGTLGTVFGCLSGKCPCNPDQSDPNWEEKCYTRSKPKDMCTGGPSGPTNPGPTDNTPPPATQSQSAEPKPVTPNPTTQVPKPKQTPKSSPSYGKGKCAKPGTML